MSLREMSWSVNQYKQLIIPGDAVFLWRSGPEAGIVAAATVLTAPAMMEQDALQFAVQADKFDKVGLRVRLRIDNVYPVPLSRSFLSARLPDLSIIQSPQGTNFAITPDEVEVIRESLATHEGDEDEISDIVPGWNREGTRGFGCMHPDLGPNSGRSSTEKESWPLAGTNWET